MKRLKDIEVSVQGCVATVVLNKPESLNAMSLKTLSELVEACDHLCGLSTLESIKVEKDRRGEKQGGGGGAEAEKRECSHFLFAY